ncbi:MAG: hypothetical protein KBB77_02465 [Candidatus Moranbacteria bacterium]|nr:hypothetical protein [Candidatus Moranbacteria bacterium]
MGTKIELFITMAIELFDTIVYRLAPDRLNMIGIHRRLQEEDQRLMTNLQKIPS